ncbi:MAG: metallophosphoesterase [Erysipelotrichaceae bacterium]
MKYKIILVVCVTIVLIGGWLYFNNGVIGTTHYTITHQELPTNFSGFKIVHISDFHNTDFGNNNNKDLVAMITGENPDIIVITGDMIDSRRTDIEISLAFAKEIQKIAPVYYVNGNHESRIAEYDKFEAQLQEIGVIVLSNETQDLTINEQSIQIVGLNDPDFYNINDKEYVEKQLELLINQSDKSKFTILLIHRPELFESYAEYGVDLSFSGHAHGGQIRLPFFGGIVAPDQGIFPKYDGGIYQIDDSYMVLSRGLGNSLFPLRVNNNPELVVVELLAS